MVLNAGIIIMPALIAYRESYVFNNFKNCIHYNSIGNITGTIYLGYPEQTPLKT